MLKIIAIILMLISDISDKQADVLKNANYDVNLASGSIRSGKTFAFNYRWLYFLGQEAEPGVDCIISGKKGESVKRNVVNDLLKTAEKEGIRDRYKYTRVPHELIYLPKKITCYIEGGNDEQAQERVKGMTAQAWLADEVTTYPRSFSMECVGRCSAGKRYKFLTCNPDNPEHYVKKEFIDKIESGSIDGRVWYFDLEHDNPVLSRQYIEQLKKIYTGVFYDRYILGKWVASEGAIYDMFSRANHVVEDYPIDKVTEYIIGIDWGYGKDHPLSIGLFAVTNDSYYCIDEIYQEGLLINDNLKEIMQDKGWFNLPIHYFNGIKLEILETRPTIAYADNSRPDCMMQFYNLSNIATVGGDKRSVLDGIHTVQRLLNSQRLYFLSKCINHINDFEIYQWDVYKSGEGKDKPKKQNDHAPDGTRYALHTRETGGVRQVRDFRHD